MNKSNKIRVNITVDKANLEKAKKKLNLFGGKLSTLFNSYLGDFVKTMDKEFNGNQKIMEEKIKELDERLKRVEKEKTKHL